MKVALITSSAPCGKGESFVISEANALADAGMLILMVPTVMRTGGQFKTVLRPNIQLVAHGLLAFKVLTTCFKVTINKPVTVIKAAWALRCLSPVTLAKNLAVFPKALWLADLVENESIEHIHAHWLSTPSTVAMLASMLTGVSWSCTAHRGDIVANNLLDRKLSHAAFVRFISSSGISLAKEHCLDVESKARLLHMGVEIPATQITWTDREPLVVLCPANLVRVKGHRFLLEAWSKLSLTRPVKLLLAGDGELRDELEKQAMDLGLMGTVNFLGHVPHAALLAMYERNAVDLVVLPSLDLGRGKHEGIPVSLIEAMAYGVPVISTATGGIPELLINGTGIIVPQADPVALAEEIVKVLNDRDSTFTQTHQARAWVVQEFNNKTIVEKLLKWFAETQVQVDKNC